MNEITRLNLNGTEYEISDTRARENTALLEERIEEAGEELENLSVSFSQEVQTASETADKAEKVRNLICRETVCSADSLTAEQGGWMIADGYLMPRQSDTSIRLGYIGTAGELSIACAQGYEYRCAVFGHDMSFENETAWIGSGDETPGGICPGKYIFIEIRRIDEEEILPAELADALVISGVESLLSDRIFGIERESGGGISPTITVSDITGGHRLTITDVRGTRIVDVLDGANGQNGHTPVKGTDFFTAADIAEIVQDVIDALPRYNGGVE